ncbi:hypothetical protein HAZT_HAZT002037, partial [Hyalella azteca]
MNHNQSDECPECPLCMELLEMDDINFFPCTCGYQICRFCWHRLRTDENGLCPACRKPYTESPADYKPLTQEELQKIKQEKKQKELIRKQKVTENRKHLSNVRVVQKNLVFVVGLSSRLADAEALKKMEYFGKFGKIHKVVINHTTSYAGSQGPSASAYVTYQRAEDALKAISQVNNIHVDGRTLKVSLGTTKYCSHFMKNQQCPKNDCMYLHELGDEAASFTKEEMQQGKHQEFEKKLQEHYLGVGSTKNGFHTAGIQPLDSIVISPGEGWPSLNLGGSKDLGSNYSGSSSEVKMRTVPVAAAALQQHERVLALQSPETRAEDVSEPSFLRDVTPPADAANDPFHDHIITSLNNVVDSHETTQQLSSASLHSGDWDIGDRTEQPLSVNATCATADIWSNTTKACESIDDELGFDPFEETNKALAQDIIMEKQKEQLQRHQLHEQQRQQQQSFHQLQQLRQQVDSQNGHAGLKAFMSSGGESLGGIGAARLPPPGFNGVVTSIHNVSNNVSRNRVDINKLFSGISSSLGNNLSNQSPQLNGLISNRLPHGPPPGMSMLSNLQGHQPGLDPSAGRSGVSTNPLLAALEASSAHSLAQQQPGPPPGLSLPKQDSFAMKDLENAFPTLTSLNRMNSLNTLESSTNALNPSLSSFSNVNGLASLNGLSLSSLNNGGLGLNFCNLNAPQQQNSLSQLNAFSGMNLAQAQQQSVNTPGWTNNSNGAPDLTALDPAIVSSGQLTDSRSDSPPEWLRLMDGPASTWSSLLPTQNQQTPNSSTLSQQQHL